MDFTEDSLASGRRFRTLNVVDAFTRECLGIEDARRKIEECRVDYNEVRPHSSLDNQTRMDFARSSNRTHAGSWPLAQ